MEKIPEQITKGFISFLITATIALVSAISTLIATRKLDVIDFGTYQFLILFSSLFQVLLSPINFFSTRFFARKFNVIKETLLIGALITFLSDLVFISILFTIELGIFEIGLSIIFLAAIYFAAQSFFSIFTGIISGMDPIHNYISNLIQSLARLVILFVFLYTIGIEIWSLIIALILSNFFSILYYVIIVKDFEGEKNGKLFIDSLKNYWVFPIFITVFNAAIYYDSAIAALLFASTLPIAYFRSAFILSLPVSYVQSFIGFYYRKFLASYSLEGFSQALKVMFLLGSMIMFGIFSFGDLLLSILRPEYAVSYTAACALSLSQLFVLLSSFISSSILGVEKVDLLESKSKIKGTSLFEITKISIFQFIIQFSLLGILAYIARSQGLSPVLISNMWSLIWLSSSIFAFFSFYRLIRRRLEIRMPYKQIFYYSLSGFLAFLITFFSKPKSFPTNISSQIISATPIIIEYLLIYFLCLFLIDISFRKKIINLINAYLFRS